MDRKSLDEKAQTEPQVASSSPSDAPHEVRHAFVIAVANQKGGVAKTTTVSSLGGALVTYGKEVLLVDLDAQANLTLALGKDPARVRSAVTEVFFNSVTLLSVSRETSIAGLDIVPSNSGMELAERFLPVRKNYESILQKSFLGGSETIHRSDPTTTGTSADLGLTSTDNFSSRSLYSTEPALNVYDFIILDCPPFIGAVTLNALTAADMLIIPAQPEFFSAHALRTMMMTIRQVREVHNPKLVYRILITMFDKRNRIHRNVNEQIRSTFGTGVLQTTIQIDTKLRESAVEGLPITHHKSNTRSALQYQALAQELIDYVRSKSIEPTSPRQR
jgi:chromosome partitioning protein